MKVTTTVATPEFPDRVWVVVSVHDKLGLKCVARISFPYGLITDPIQLAQDVCEGPHGVRLKNDDNGEIIYVPWTNVGSISYRMETEQ